MLYMRTRLGFLNWIYFTCSITLCLDLQDPPALPCVSTGLVDWWVADHLAKPHPVPPDAPHWPLSLSLLSLLVNGARMMVRDDRLRTGNCSDDFLKRNVLSFYWCEFSYNAGLSSRPAVRGMQRQTFASRSSIASPLVLSENGTKPSWSHSAKLQLRSNSPSRFSLESHSSSPTLERIGEVVDNKLPTSCFAASPKPDKLSGGKLGLAALDSNPGSKRLIDQVHSKAVAQAEQRSSIQAGDNNNVVSAAEQVSPRHGAAAKELKQRNGSTDSAGVKKTSMKTGLESERSPKKRPATSSTSSSSLSPASPAIDKSPSRAQTKTAASASNPKDKNDGPPKTSKAGSSRTATPSKKGPSQTPEVLHPESAQQRKNGSPGLQSSHPQRKTSPRVGGEKSSASGRTRAADRSTSRESSRTSAASERKVNHGGPPSRSSAASRVEGRPGRAAENRTAGRSSSSSSSMTSLRSSSVGVSSASAAPPSRGPRGNSKTEDKGLSFFKTALRPKDTRKSADGGKAGVGEAKGSPEDVGVDAAKEGIPHRASKKAQNVASEAQTNVTTAKDKESSKASTAAKHSLLPSTKSKLSGGETATHFSANAKDPLKKEPAKKTMQSRKIPINSTQTSQRSKWHYFEDLITIFLVQLWGVLTIKLDRVSDKHL